jgi:hypothetical protein
MRRSFRVAYYRFLVRQRLQTEVLPTLPGSIVRADPRTPPLCDIRILFASAGLLKAGWPTNASVYGA